MNHERAKLEAALGEFAKSQGYKLEPYAAGQVLIPFYDNTATPKRWGFLVKLMKAEANSGATTDSKVTPPKRFRHHLCILFPVAIREY